MIHITQSNHKKCDENELKAARLLLSAITIILRENRKSEQCHGDVKGNVIRRSNPTVNVA